MKVVSKLVKMDFKIGAMTRKDDQILITSHPSQPMQTKVYMGPEDIMGLLKAALNWSVVSYAFAWPFLYFKAKKASKNGVKQSMR